MSNYEKYPELLEWQRRLDPLKFNKATGAQFHTAPSVIFPDATEYPEDLPSDAITILFHIDEDDWLGEPEKTSIDDPILIEKPPRSKRSKHGSVVIMDENRAYAIVPYKENYYWSAQILTYHKTLRITFKPGKKRADGKHMKIVVIATFMPNDDEK